jgi:predicted dehydrogenase
MKKKKTKTNRRHFLKTLAGASLTGFGFPFVLPSSALGLSGNISPANRITLGCIGTGNQGFQDMKGFLQLDEVQIVAVCDVNKGSYGYKTPAQFRGREPARTLVNERYAEKIRSGQYRGCDAYADFRDIISRDDIDAVLIVTPDHWHAIPVIMAAKAGKDIYCEKPLALTIAQGQKMVEAVRKYGRVFQTGTHHRSADQHLRFCCELIRNGRIGQVKRVVTVLGPHPLRKKNGPWSPMPIPASFDYDMWLGPAPWAPYHKNRCFYTFRFIKDYAGGEPTNTGAHSFDIIQWALDTEHTGPVEFEDLGSSFADGDYLYTAVSTVNFRARYADGTELLCFSEGNYMPNLVARFEGSEGWIEAGWYQLKTYPASLKTSVIRPDEINLYKSTNHYQNFIDCVKTRRDPIAPVETGHRSTSIAHLANIAMALKDKLHWDPARERFSDNEQANRMLSRPMRPPWYL